MASVSVDPLNLGIFTEFLDYNAKIEAEVSFNPYMEQQPRHSGGQIVVLVCAVHECPHLVCNSGGSYRKKSGERVQ